MAAALSQRGPGREAKVATRDPGVQDWEQYARVQGAEYRI